MGLLRRIFGTAQKDGSGTPTSQFHESEPTSEEEGSRNAPRRELVQVVLRDTMRKHGIPSDWIECRILSTVSRSGRPGMHVNFVVKQAHDRLLGYVFAFQGSFESELARFEPRARDWLMGLGWEFEGHNLTAPMPDPQSWAHSTGNAPLGMTTGNAPLVDKNAFASTGSEAEVQLPKSDDDIQRDLEKLFAIRDAAIADTTKKPPAARDYPATEFQNTQPFDDDDDDEDARKPRR